MNYKFDKLVMGSFTVYQAAPRLGSIHRKRFSAGVTPANQATLNLYAGRFKFVIPSIGFEQTMLPGQSSLDLLIDEFPVGEVCDEFPLDDGAVRFCLSPTTPQKWRRAVVSLDGEHALAAGSVVFPVAGDVLVGGVPCGLHRPVAADMVSGSGRAILIEVI